MALINYLLYPQDGSGSMIMAGSQKNHTVLRLIFLSSIIHILRRMPYNEEAVIDAVRYFVIYEQVTEADD